MDHTVNPCKTCSPLGASLAMKGIKNSMCILHGSQGCSTYIRRFLIGHFREPIDIASSSFDENTAVFGGKENLLKGLENMIQKYDPEVIGIATSCLAETIGEDVGMYMKEMPEKEKRVYIHAETASYRGTHVDGFMKMVSSLAGLAESPELKHESDRFRLNIIPWMLSPGDLRHLKYMLTSMNIEAVMLPDYSETLDGGAWEKHNPIPPGGTSVDDIKSMGCADYTIQFGPHSTRLANPAGVIKVKTDVNYSVLPLPIGIRNTDLFINEIKKAAAACGKKIELPDEMQNNRARLLDAYSDSHRYFSSCNAAVYGEFDFVSGMASFLNEIGIIPSLCMTGEKISDADEQEFLSLQTKNGNPECSLMVDEDFSGLDKAAEERKIDLLIGNSKGYKTARALDIPMIRAGFPITDRFGGQRKVHIGYEGALRLLDETANTIIAKRQELSPVGYMSM